MGIKTAFHINLRRLREEKNLSQKKAAAELGISQALLSHYEKGIRECKLDFLRKAAAYYSVSCDELLSGPETETPDEIPARNIQDSANNPYIKGVLRQNGEEFNTYHAMYNNLLVTRINKLFLSLSAKENADKAKAAGEAMLEQIRNSELIY